MPSQSVAGSFRDPSGFIFTRDGVLYRQINRRYQEHYDHLMASGLYDTLVSRRLLIPHEEADLGLAMSDEAYKVIQPTRVPFVSYPYEWSFSQLKDAALATLAIQKLALDKGLTLKDASAYNMQFHRGRAVCIDTLSLETNREGSPWVAYRQFCQHFLAPLALMSRKDVRLGQLLRVFIDGVPLDLAARLLGFRSKLSLGLLMHIHMHASSQKRHEGDAIDVRHRRMGKLALLGVIDNLESSVKKLTWKPGGTEWADYYTFTNYTDDAFERKKAVVADLLGAAGGETVWDLGANTGVFSRLASDRGMDTVAFDIDPAAVERNYQEMLAREETNLLPLVMDLTNPSGGIGWSCQERQSLADRGPADTVMALALIHHLAISNNVPLAMLARFFRGVGRKLIIEFIPKEDSKVQVLLASREDVFDEYDREHFEQAFSRHFTIERSVAIEDTCRTMYLMS